MKKVLIFIAAVTVMMACEKQISTDINASHTVTFEAVASDGTKAVLDLNGNGKPQTFWEDGDRITVYTQADGNSGSQRGYEFTTALNGNATSAKFTYTGDGCADGNYLAIFPAASEGRAVNFTGEGDIYKMAAVDVPATQTLVPGSFDRQAAVMTAYAPAGSSALHFKNAVALLKFRVSGSGVKGGSIVADATDYISGRFRADLSTTEPYLPVLTKYNQTAYNYVNFTIDGSTDLASDVDYYVAVRPTSLADGMKIYLNDVLVKTIPASTATELARGQIYNLGTFAAPAASNNKVLTFDFTGDPLVGWPTDQNKAEFPHVEGGYECVYPLDAVDYTFVLADCGQATNTSAQLFWHTGTKALVFNAQKRYLGLPAINGYKLTKVVCANKSGTTNAQFEIVKSISSNTDHPAASEIVSAAQTWSTKGADYTYYLSNLEGGKMYYLYALVKGSMGSVTLTYEPI